MFTRKLLFLAAAFLSSTSVALAAGVSLGPTNATSTSIGTGGGVSGFTGFNGFNSFGFNGFGTGFNSGFVGPSVVVPAFGGAVQSFYDSSYDYNDQPTQVIERPVVQPAVAPHIVEPLIEEWNTPSSHTHRRILRGHSSVHRRTR